MMSFQTPIACRMKIVASTGLMRVGRNPNT